MADGCEEIELVTIIDILRRSATRVTVAGLNGDPVTGSRGGENWLKKPLDTAYPPPEGLS